MMKYLILIGFIFTAFQVHADGGINDIDDVKTCYIADVDDLINPNQVSKLKAIGYKFDTGGVLIEKGEPVYIPFITRNAFGLEYRDKDDFGYYHVYNSYPETKPGYELVSEGVDVLLSYGECTVD